LAADAGKAAKQKDLLSMVTQTHQKYETQHDLFLNGWQGSCSAFNNSVAAILLDACAAGPWLHPNETPV
jgi:hypothetical protein